MHYSGRAEIPGLYDDQAGLMTPIQGQEQFNRLVLGRSLLDEQTNKSTELLDCDERSKEALRELINRQTLSLVQFYMATCPDCQGFSPYFKRFIRDISPHWRPLVKIYTVNCNDFKNIHLCQQENPKLVVPMVRWYALPILQLAHLSTKPSESGYSLQLNSSSCTSFFRYSRGLLNVAHRKFIEKQRRDLISLRKATLSYIELMMEELRSKKAESKGAQTLFDFMPYRWHSLKQLGARQHYDLHMQLYQEHRSRELIDRYSESSSDPLDAFLGDLMDRESQCSKKHHNVRLGDESSQLIRLIVFEHKPWIYSLGRTIVADWSNWTTDCNTSSLSIQTTSLSSKTNVTLRTYWTSDLSVLNQLMRIINKTSGDDSNSELPAPWKEGRKVDWPKFSPIAVSLSSMATGRPTRAHFLAANFTSLQFEFTGIEEEPSSSMSWINKRHAISSQRLARINQRASLQRYYSQNPSSLSSRPFRFAGEEVPVAGAGQYHGMAPVGENGYSLGASRIKRLAEDSDRQKDLAQADAEHINWAPELLWPKVEAMRYKINKAIARELKLSDWPGYQLGGKNPGELAPKKPDPDMKKITVEDIRDDDLSLMMLTDYYKSLDEIVHIDLIAKGEVDGYQLLAATCFLNTLSRYFPFQGSAQAPKTLGNKSLSRYYLQLLQRRWYGELLYKLVDKKPGIFTGKNFNENACPNLLEEDKNSTRAILSSTTIGRNKLDSHQTDLQKQVGVGLAPTSKLSWKYCAGSEPNLRGHTCSLWVLFHTLTVEEYLERQRSMASSQDDDQESQQEEKKEPYRFQIFYDRPPRRPCDPKNPEKAFLDWSSSEHYVVSNGNNVLANIINFVRFYLPCTNCAAHFSCMVEHSPDLNFNDQQPQQQQETRDLHLLWLWEGHNRVNLRTRGTHSEDLRKPKHVFPIYEACPKCYLERPTGNITEQSFGELKFNRQELVKFVVSRYRKSAILNNKINIEELFKPSG